MTDPLEDIELLRARLAGDREQAAVVAGRIFDHLTGNGTGDLVELRRAFVRKLVDEAFSPEKMTEIDELKSALRLGGKLGNTGDAR